MNKMYSLILQQLCCPIQDMQLIPLAVDFEEINKADVVVFTECVESADLHTLCPDGCN